MRIAAINDEQNPPYIFLQGRHEGVPCMCVLLERPQGKLPLPGTTYGPLRWVVNAATWWQRDGSEPAITGYPP